MEYARKIARRLSGGQAARDPRHGLAAGARVAGDGEPGSPSTDDPASAGGAVVPRPVTRGSLHPRPIATPDRTKPVRDKETKARRKAEHDSHATQIAEGAGKDAKRADRPRGKTAMLTPPSNGCPQRAPDPRGAKRLRKGPLQTQEDEQDEEDGEEDVGDEDEDEDDVEEEGEVEEDDSESKDIMLHVMLHSSLTAKRQMDVREEAKYIYIHMSSLQAQHSHLDLFAREHDKQVQLQENKVCPILLDDGVEIAKDLFLRCSQPGQLNRQLRATHTVMTEAGRAPDTFFRQLAEEQRLKGSVHIYVGPTRDDYNKEWEDQLRKRELAEEQERLRLEKIARTKAQASNEALRRQRVEAKMGATPHAGGSVCTDGRGRGAAASAELILGLSRSGDATGEDCSDEDFQ